MQNKHERFWEEAQPQVGVWAASAVYGAAEPQVSPSRGPSVVTPPSPPNSSRMLFSPGAQAADCKAPGLPPLRRERNRTPAPGDSDILGLAAPGDQGEGWGAAPHFGEPVWGESASESSIISMPLHRTLERRWGRQWKTSPRKSHHQRVSPAQIHMLKF